MSRKTLPTILSRSLPFAALIFVLASAASAQWNEQVLYSFQGGTDGAEPSGGVIMDKAGNLYGTTAWGGASNCVPVSACGTVFELSPPTGKGGAWTETVLHVFKGSPYGDGAAPGGGVIMDEAGNLYGITAYGGTGSCLLFGIAGGCGTVYELSPPAKSGEPWTETLLYSFQGGSDGYFATGPLTFDKNGNLYGATVLGGGQGPTCVTSYGDSCGTIFELSPPKTEGGEWTEKVLHAFTGGADGSFPNGGLIFNGEGVLYGTTAAGGNQKGDCNESGGCGSVFRLIPEEDGKAWIEEILLRFNIQNGKDPGAGVILDKRGNLYGTFYSGGAYLAGGVFELAKPDQQTHSWTEKVLHSFSGDNYFPTGALLIDPSGNLYGTDQGTEKEGEQGVVFELEPPADGGTSWQQITLYTFKDPPDGFDPMANLLPDGHGHLYTTTVGGGTGQACQLGCGTVVELWP
jgi:hypothetical protein